MDGATSTLLTETSLIKMQFTKILAGTALVLAASAMASPVAQPKLATQLEARHNRCTSGNATLLGE